ncbi:MAG: ester cyclase [Arenicellales bacterium]|nr:ester cyclase [Arenicellales bacterium]
MASDATMEDIAVGSKSVGSDEVPAYAKNWKTIFPDMVGTCENRHDAGDVLVEECSWTGTNTGNIATPDGNTIPPTGKSVNLRNVLIWEYQDGKVKSVKNYLDMMTMMSQLGLAG